MTNKIIHGDNVEVLKTYPENFFHSVVTDPPYGLKFMNKHWDYDVPQVEFWREVLRVLKPGGYVLSFGGTRTYHRMAVNIEDAGFIIRDQLQWIYGSGFPKSLNIGKAVDKFQGNEREKIGEWEGYGTVLKPANEPICLAMKPLSEKNFAENVLKHGAGGLNIEASRIGNGREQSQSQSQVADRTKDNCNYYSKELGRFPSNVILDEEAGAMLNGEARFFYCSKASSSERNAGMRWDSEKKLESGIQRGSYGSFNGRSNYYKNYHVSVKPLNLMRYLVRLVTPKGGIVLEPFAGSGTTLLAAKKEGFEFVGIERELEYCKIAEQRLEAVAINETLF
jgi:site-specific DNA-methyltransferase (adenine-specific)